MQYVLLWTHPYSFGLFGLSGQCQQATLLHDVREEHKQGLIGTEHFTNQHEAQSGHIRLITMRAGLCQESSPLLQEASHGPGDERFLP